MDSDNGISLIKISLSKIRSYLEKNSSYKGLEVYMFDSIQCPNIRAKGNLEYSSIYVIYYIDTVYLCNI